MLDFAGHHRLPVVCVWERTRDAGTVPPPPGSAQVIVDGSDALEVHAATQAALIRARNGQGPSLITCELGPDPLPTFRAFLLGREVLTDDHASRIEAEADAEVDAAVRTAEGAAAPQPTVALTRVYARPIADMPDPPTIPSGGAEATVVEALRQVQRELLAGDDRVAILGRAATTGGVFRATEGLLTDVADRRVLDVPLPETTLVGLGIGLALAGMRPIVELPMADAIHGAFDQIAGEAAKLHYRSNGAFAVPIVIRCPWGGGLRGGLYRSQAVEAFFAHVAGLKVVVPSTPADAAGLLRAAVADPDPVLFLEHKLLYRLARGPVPKGDWRVPIGQAEVVRPGDDLTIVTYGLHRHLALQAADTLAEDDGVSIEVIDLRTISPLDTDTVLTSATRTGRVLVVHEDNVSFGVGAEVAAVVADQAFYDLDAPVRRLAMPDVPAMPYAAPLEAAVMIGAGDIATAARDLLAV
jgi:pyruvate/2-oxoglutarate/acetoin dehydrogenase E1 component